MPPFGKPYALALLALAAFAAGGAAQTVNGCAFASATAAFDLPSPVTVIASGFAYSPPCLVVRESQSVRWSMSLLTHPLRPGEVVGGVPQPPAPGNPIQATSSGTEVTFAFPDEGTYPYYCNNHFFTFGMMGSIFVVLFAEGFEDGDLCDWSAVVPVETCQP